MFVSPARAWWARILDFFKRPRRPAHVSRREGPRSDARYAKGERGTRAWREVRAFVVKRDGACLACGSKEGLTVDHVRPLSEGGSNAPANLRTLCKACHRERHGG